MIRKKVVGQRLACKPQQKPSPGKSKGKSGRSKDKLKKLLQNKHKPKKSQYDSNNSTATHTILYNDSRLGGKRRSSQQLEQLAIRTELLLHEKQIGLILNMMARRIQRAWRRYYSKKMLASVPARRPINSISDLSQKTEEGFNNRKYVQSGSLSKLLYQGKADPKVQSINRLSLWRLPEPKDQNNHQQESVGTSHRNSISLEIEEQLAARRSIELVSGTLNVHIAPAARLSSRFDDVYVKTPRCNFIQMIDKCQTLLQKQKAANLLSIENRYARNLLTERTYLKLQGELESCYRREKQLIGKKRSGYKSNWHEVHKLLRSIRQDRKFEEDSFSCMDHSWSRGSALPNNEIEQVLQDLVNNSDKQVGPSKRLQKLVDSVELGHYSLQEQQPEPHPQPIVIEESASPVRELIPYIPIEQEPQLLADLPPSQQDPPANRILGIIQDRQLNKLTIDVADYTAEIINRLVQEFLQAVLSKYFIMTNLKMLKGRRKVKKLPYRLDTSIDAVNNWLLEAAHFVLDYHKQEFEHNILKPNVTSTKEFLRGGAIHTFQCISLETFSEFEYYYVKRLKESIKLDPKHEEGYTSMVNVHDLCLYNSLNEAISGELGITKQQRYAPWFGRRSFMKVMTKDSSKGLLERSINVVSQWAEASLGSTSDNTAYRPSYNQEQIHALLEILEIPLTNLQAQTKLCLQIVAEIERHLLGQLLVELSLL